MNNLGEPHRTDAACIHNFRKAKLEHPDAIPERGIFASDLSSAVKMYKDNVKSNTSKKLGGFMHIRAKLPNGTIIDPLAPKKSSPFFSEAEIVKSL